MFRDVKKMFQKIYNPTRSTLRIFNQSLMTRLELSMGKEYSAHYQKQKPLIKTLVNAMYYP